MKRFTVIVAICTLIIAMLVKSGVVSALMIFLFIGAIPGTTISVSANTMLLIVGVIAWLVLFRGAAIGAIDFLTMRRLVGKHSARLERRPKHRFSRI